MWGRTRTASFQRKTDAKSWAANIESELRRGKYVADAEALRRTVGDLVDRYIRELPHKARNKSSAKTKQQLEWWKAELGRVAIADCTPAVVIEARDRLAQGTASNGRPRGRSTVNRYLAALSHAFSTAVREWQWTDTNPVASVSKLAEPRGRTRFLSDDERARLLEACRASRNPDLYSVVVLALSTGARRGEILGLRWGDVDLPRGVIVLRDTKNTDTRAAPLVSHAHELLKARKKVRRVDTDMVFPGRKKHRPQDIKKSWHAALAAAGIEDFRFHDLRHSAASYLAMSGATLAEIAEVLGHRTLQMVKRYAHLTEAHTSRVVARMNAGIFG